MMPAEDGPVDVAVLLRVSTEDQKEANQEPDCRAFCSARGWRIVEVYREHGVSGDAAERPEKERLMSDARLGRFRVVVVWALDRWTRAGIEPLLRDVRLLSESKVRLVSVQESWCDTGGPMGELLLAIVAWVAKQEKARRAERQRLGLERARAELAANGKIYSRSKRIRDNLGRPRTIPAEAVARASELRRRVGYGESASWGWIRGQLAQEGLGTFGRTALANAVRRSKECHKGGAEIAPSDPPKSGG